MRAAFARAVQLAGEIAMAPGRLAALDTQAWLWQAEARARAAATAAVADAEDRARAAERNQWAAEQREAVTARALAAALARAEEREVQAKQVPELRRKVATAEALLEGARQALAESERYGEKMRSAAEDELRIARECRRQEREAEGRARAALRLAQSLRDLFTRKVVHAGEPCVEAGPVAEASLAEWDGQVHALADAGDDGDDGA